MDLSISREVEMLTTAGAALSTSSVKSGSRGSARAGVACIKSKARLISQVCEWGLGITMGSFRDMEHGNHVWYSAHYAKFHTPSSLSGFR